jgi:hypothetical protein
VSTVTHPAPAHAPDPGVGATYGMLAEFDTPEAVVAAAQSAYADGYRKMDAYSPMPVDGLAEAMGFTRNYVSLMVFVAGLSGALIAYMMQWYTSAIDYPIIVAGKPYHSWPSFVPITFELTILFAAGIAVFGMLGLNGLPRPHHPIFNAPNFAAASQDRFFLCIEAVDPRYDEARTRQFLESLHPLTVTEVEA